MGRGDKHLKQVLWGVRPPCCHLAPNRRLMSSSMQKLKVLLTSERLCLFSSVLHSCVYVWERRVWMGENNARAWWKATEWNNDYRRVGVNSNVSLCFTSTAKQDKTEQTQTKQKPRHFCVPWTSWVHNLILHLNEFLQLYCQYVCKLSFSALWNEQESICGSEPAVTETRRCLTSSVHMALIHVLTWFKAVEHTACNHLILCSLTPGAYCIWHRVTDKDNICSRSFCSVITGKILYVTRFFFFLKLQ